MITLQALSTQLLEIREELEAGELQAGELQAVQLLLIRHDRDVRGFLHSEPGRNAGPGPLAQLLQLQRELEGIMRAHRDQAGQQAHSSHQADRAARAYLALSGN